jgi:hypothetical protein
MTKDQIGSVLDAVRSWPLEDQEELATIARAIEARRSGTYVMTDEERAAIAKARTGRLVSEEEATAFWTRLGIG